MLCRRPGMGLSTLFFLIALAACRPQVEVSPPPPEERYRSPLPPALDSHVEMSQIDADRYIVSGVGESAGKSSRWAGPRVVLQFLAPPFLDMKFFLQFNLSEPVVKKAGGVVMRISVDEALFEEKSFSEAGEYLIQKTAESGSLRWDSETQVLIEMTPRQPSGMGENELRFRLSAAGFRP